MKKIACVFGGSGFLGSHVADKLSNEGFLVRIFDKEPSRWLQDEQEMIVGDILDYDQVYKAVKGSDVVYNFAALADLNDALSKPIESIKINILGNGYIMDACQSHGIKRFIYASTVYVSSRSGGFYRCSKQSSEKYVEEFQRVYGLNYTILRFGSLYGPRSDASNGLYRIVKTALDSKIIKYEGSTEALREYIHVEDAARASVAALEESFMNKSVILTGQEPMRVEDLLKMLQEILGNKQEIEFSKVNQAGHYVRTPYAHDQEISLKYLPPMHVDIGQGLLQLIDQISNEHDKK